MRNKQLIIEQRMRVPVDILEWDVYACAYGWCCNLLCVRWNRMPWNLNVSVIA